MNIDDPDDFHCCVHQRVDGRLSRTLLAVGPEARFCVLQLRKTYDGCLVERNALFLAFAAVGASW